MREEAMKLFGKPYVLEINCGRYHSIKDTDKFFQRLAKKLDLSDEVEDSMDFEDVLIERFQKADPCKTFLLIVGFERLHEDVRNAFAETLRNLNEEYGGHFNLVIFGGQKLIQLKYSTGIHSYFNNFEQKMIPSFSFEEWQETYPYLTANIYNEIVKVTGHYAKLSEVCLKAKVQNEKEAEELLTHSLWSSELFRAYRKEKDKLSLLLSKEELGSFHPYCDDELLYKLYWDNLIVEEKGVFVWRSAFLVKMGKEALECK
jgi:RNAse (barnase) inhibitor barstar